MKKRLLGLLLGVMLVSVCVGCGAENTTTEPMETKTEAITEETVEPTPEMEEQPSEEATTETESETETTEIAELEPTEEPTAEPQAIYTYTDMTATMYAQQTVNVRDLPSTDGNKIGSLSTNDEISVTGQCNETGWFKFVLIGLMLIPKINGLIWVNISSILLIHNQKQIKCVVLRKIQ